MVETCFEPDDLEIVSDFSKTPKFNRKLGKKEGFLQLKNVAKAEKDNVKQERLKKIEDRNLKRAKLEELKREREALKESKIKEKMDREAERLKQKVERESMKLKEKLEKELEKQEKERLQQEEQNKICKIKEKQKQVFEKFFMKTTTPLNSSVQSEKDSSSTKINNTVIKNKNGFFKPFVVKKFVLLAPLKKTIKTLDSNFDETINKQNTLKEDLYLKRTDRGLTLSDQNLTALPKTNTIPKSKLNILNKDYQAIYSDECLKKVSPQKNESDDVIIEDYVNFQKYFNATQTSIPTNNRYKVKLLQFHENHRPAYYGTFKSKTFIQRQLNASRRAEIENALFDTEANDNNVTNNNFEGQSQNGVTILPTIRIKPTLVINSMDNCNLETPENVAENDDGNLKGVIEKMETCGENVGENGALEMLPNKVNNTANISQYLRCIKRMARNPFLKLESPIIDYSYDSDEDWEECDMGESLHSNEKEDDEELDEILYSLEENPDENVQLIKKVRQRKLQHKQRTAGLGRKDAFFKVPKNISNNNSELDENSSESDYESDDGFIVEHGYLSVDELSCHSDNMAPQPNNGIKPSDMTTVMTNTEEMDDENGLKKFLVKSNNTPNHDMDLIRAQQKLKLQEWKDALNKKHINNNNNLLGNANSSGDAKNTEYNAKLIPKVIGPIRCVNPYQISKTDCAAHLTEHDELCFQEVKSLQACPLYALPLDLSSRISKKTYQILTTNDSTPNKTSAKQINKLETNTNSLSFSSCIKHSANSLTNGSHDESIPNGNLSVTGNAKKLIPESAIPYLAKFVHGNSKSIVKIVSEFQALWWKREAKSDSLLNDNGSDFADIQPIPSLPNLLCKKHIENTIKYIATYLSSDKNAFNRACWILKDEFYQQYHDVFETIDIHSQIIN